MKKAAKIFVPVVLVILCIALGLYLNLQRNTHPDTTADTDISTTKISKYQSYIDQNSDFVGYIKIDGTDIDFPVVQGEDDEFYLNHNFDKEEEERGAIYMSSACNPDKLDFNTVIYGHNWLDDTVFSQLVHYDDIAFYKEHPVIRFDGIYDDRQWKIFAVFITNADENEDNGYVFNYIYPHLGGDNFTGYMSEVNKRTLYKTGVDINENDKILTLSTCSRKMDTRNYRADARIVIVARLVREGESAQVDVSRAELNPNPKYPQRYCNLMGITNTYANDEYWYPYENEQSV